jgi:outer membrane protein TolC
MPQPIGSYRKLSEHSLLMGSASRDERASLAEFMSEPSLDASAASGPLARGALARQEVEIQRSIEAAERLPTRRSPMGRATSEGSLKFASALTAAALVLLAPATALALQPLSTFVVGAKSANLDTASAKATAAQRAEEADQAWAKLGPTLTARAAYTRNQYEAVVTLPSLGGAPGKTATITPLNQWDATFTVDLPLVDFGSWSKIGAAKANLDAADARVLASQDDVEKIVAQTYTRIVAAEALVVSAQKELDVAEANLGIVRSKKAAGSASDLDVERALAEVARTKQDGADAAYTVATSRNALHSLTGIVPTDGAPTLDDDLHTELPLATFLPGADAIPSVKAAGADVAAAKKNEDAAYDALLPTIGATATERFTNAVGFGTSPVWTAGVFVQIKLDLFTFEGAKVSSAATEVAKAKEAKVRLDAHDAVFDAWHLVESSIVKSSAARAQEKASTHAATLARDRYAVGTGTQLDVIQADRDAFSAEVARIQADADLVYARALLRIASGRSIEIGGAS